MNRPPLLKVREASSFLQVHPKTLYKWTDAGKIPFRKINGLLRFRLEDIERGPARPAERFPALFEGLTQLSFRLADYDRMLLKGRSALGKKSSRRWNYGFGALYIRKTKGGKDRWYLDYRDETGRRTQRLAKHALRREDALLALQAEVAKCFAREHPGASRSKQIGFSAFVDLYIENYAKTNKKSWRDDECRLKKFASSTGNVYLHEITPLEIEKFKLAKLQQGREKSTVNRYLAILKRMFNVAMSWGYARENPLKLVKFYPEKDNLKERILASDEEIRLLEAASAHLRPIVVVALNTGMRRGEILGLRWEQVDLRVREIRIENTKSGKPRTVDINSLLLSELTRLRDKGTSGQYVFLNPKTGKPYTKLQRSFAGACSRAGIKGLRFHDLRHTFASRLVEKGVDIIRVKELLGHSTVRITERYTHSNREERKKAVELLCEKDPKEAEMLPDLLHSCDTDGKKKDSGKVISLFSVN